MSLLLSEHDFLANFHWWCCPVGWEQACLPPLVLVYKLLLSAWAKLLFTAFLHLASSRIVDLL